MPPRFLCLPPAFFRSRACQREKGGRQGKAGCAGCIPPGFLCLPPSFFRCRACEREQGGRLGYQWCASPSGRFFPQISLPPSQRNLREKQTANQPQPAFNKPACLSIGGGLTVFFCNFVVHRGCASHEMPATDQAGATCPLHGPPHPHVLVPAGAAGSGFEGGTVLVLAQTGGTPAHGLVRCLVLRGRDTRVHLRIAAGRTAAGVLGWRATNARVWLGRPAHVLRCLELFDDPARPQHAHGSAAVAFTRFELYVCWAGAASWAAGTIQQCQIDGGDSACAAGESADVGGGDSGNEAAWDEQCRESFEEAGERVAE